MIKMAHEYKIKHINFKISEEDHQLLRIWSIKQGKTLTTLFYELMLNEARKKCHWQLNEKETRHLNEK